jgi:hypothetical protein
MDFRKNFFLVDNPMNILPSMIQNGSVVSEIKIMEKVINIFIPEMILKSEMSDA